MCFVDQLDNEEQKIFHNNTIQLFCTGVQFKETRSVTMKFFQKKSFLFKSFVKIDISYVFTINMFSTAENCMEK